MMSTGSVVGAGALVKSVAFPRVILPVATVLFNLVQFLLTIAVFLPVALLIFGIAPTPAILLFPVLLALQILFTSGVAFALATLTSFFRDVSHILEIALGILFWTTPILYQYDSLPELLRLPILLSPMSSFVVAYQQIFHLRACAGSCRLACGRQLRRRHVRSRCVAVRRHRGSAGGAGLMSTVIESQGLSKRFLLRHNRSGSIKERFLGLIHTSHRERTEEFWALRDVTLSINSGEAVGIIGRNGSGKSTFLRLVAGIHRPTEGRLAVRRGARIGTMIELGIGFHPELTGTENLFLSASVHGLTRAQIEALYDRIVEYSGLAAFMDVAHEELFVRHDGAAGVRDSGQSGSGHAAARRSVRRRRRGVSAAVHPNGAAVSRRRQDHPVRVAFGRGNSEHLRSRVPAGSRAAALRRSRVARPRGIRPRGVQRRATWVRLRKRSQPPSEEGGWHRVVPGGHWVEGGRMGFRVAAREGLQPADSVLDVGCGSLSTGRHLLQFLDAGRYWGFDVNQALDSGRRHAWSCRGSACRPTTASICSIRNSISQALRRGFDLRFPRGSSRVCRSNRIARCIAAVTQRLAPDGRFYATWFENPDPRNFDPIDRGGFTTFPDAEPYHYPFEMLASICDAIGARAERVEPAHRHILAASR